MKYAIGVIIFTIVLGAILDTSKARTIESEILQNGNEKSLDRERRQMQSTKSNGKSSNLAAQETVRQIGNYPSPQQFGPNFGNPYQFGGSNNFEANLLPFAPLGAGMEFAFTSANLPFGAMPGFQTFQNGGNVNPNFGMSPPPTGDGNFFQQSQMPNQQSSNIPPNQQNLGNFNNYPNFGNFQGANPQLPLFQQMQLQQQQQQQLGATPFGIDMQQGQLQQQFMPFPGPQGGFAPIGFELTNHRFQG